jgi:hypothetical protein
METTTQEENMNQATDENYLRQEAINDLNRVQAYEPSTGCWIDDRWGHYGAARLIQITIDLGWDDEEAEDLAAEYFRGEEFPSDIDIWDVAYDAETWLNENIANPGFSFGWADGEFFLMNDEWWENIF